MLTRTLGNSSMDFSVLGLGTWAIGGGDWRFGWGDQDEAAAVATVVAACESGINWIDTAAIYGDGRSEEIVGKAVARLSAADRPWIATKCGRIMQPDGSITGCLTAESVRRECEASLQRLQIETIDLYQMHWPDPDEQIEEGWQEMVRLKEEGKVRWIGVSNHSVEQMQRLTAIAPITSLQPPYSLIAPDAESSVIPWCGGNNVGVVCYSPMGKGLLSGRFTKERAAALPENDHRSRDPRFQPPQLDVNLSFVDALRKIAEGLGWSVAELSLAWTFRDPAVTSTIVGARAPEQIRQTAVAGTRVLPDDACSAIAAATNERNKALAALGGASQPRV